MEIVTRIREFMLDELRESGFNENLTNDDSLVELGILDSLGFMILVSFFDETYGIVPNEEELDPINFDSINKIAEFITKKSF